MEKVVRIASVKKMYKDVEDMFDFMDLRDKLKLDLVKMRFEYGKILTGDLLDDFDAIIEKVNTIEYQDFYYDDVDLGPLYKEMEKEGVK